MIPNTQNATETTVAPVEILTVEQAAAVAVEAIASRNLRKMHNAFDKLAELIGPKPDKSAFSDRDSFKAAMNDWDDSRKVLRDIFNAADKAGFAQRERFNVRPLASGGINFGYAKTLTAKPAKAAWKL